MKKYISIKSFRDAVKAQDTTALDKIVTTDYVIKSVDDSSQSFKFLITNNTMDRANDVVEAVGLKVDRFMENPRVLKIHNDQEWPIGKCTNLALGSGLITRT